MLIVVTLLMGLLMILFHDCFGQFDVCVWVLIAFFSVAYIVHIIRPGKVQSYFLPLLTGYFLRIILLVYDVYTNNPLHIPLVGGPLTSDPLHFYRTAIRYADGETVSYGGLFPKVLGRIFMLTGPSRLLAEFIVLVFSVATILTFVKIVDELDIPKKDKKLGVYLICLLPNYAILSVVLRRETVITYFLAVSLLYFIRWFRGIYNEKGFVFAVVFALLASLFHGATGMIIVSYLLVHILYSPKRHTYTLETKNILGAVFFFAVVMIIYGRYGTAFFGKIEQRVVSGSYSVVRDAGGSSYAKYVGDAKTPLRMVIYAIPRFLYFLFSPFPWQWRGVADILTFMLSSFVYLYIFLNSFRSLRIMGKDNENRNLIIALLVVALITVSIFSWGVSNTGTATRHRDKFLALFCVMFVLSERSRLRLRKSEPNRRIISFPEAESGE